MTTFEKGPADGKTLFLRAAPVYLRVVKSGDEVDALDMAEDTPEPEEEIFAYKLKESRGHVHISARGKNGRRAGGIYAHSIYEYIEEQPSDEVMRDSSSWRHWAITRKASND